MRRNIGGQEVWQVYGLDGEMVAEYAAGASATSPQKEYGYRSGELLITATGGSTSPVNLAQGKPAIQSTTFSDFPASLAVDGNTNGDFNGAHTSSATNYEYQGWWQVDLQSSQTINSIKVWPRTDCCTEHLANYYVLVSDQPFQSTDLQTTLNQSGVSSYAVYGYTYSPTTVNIGRTGRYIRVQRSDSQYLVLAEVEVLGQQQGSSNADVEWIVTDQLGTPRMIADQTGSLAGIKRHDYLPFGEEIGAGAGGRTTSQGYSQVDNVRQKFTLKERDAETGLDYFINRYYSSTMGRFTSVDAAGPDVPNPQTLNKYRYALNNPLRYIDPDGRQERESLTESIRNYFAALVRRFQKQLNPEAAQEEVRTLGPIGDSDAFIEKYNRVLGERMEFATDVVMLADVTGAGTATRGYLRGNNTEMAIGMAGMVATPLSKIFGVGNAAVSSGRLLGGRIGAAEVGAQFSKSGDTLIAGIVGVFNKEGASVGGLGATTRALLDSVVVFAKEQGLAKIEVQAIAVVNPKVERFLVKQGFQKTAVLVEGEKVSAYTKTFVVK